MVKALLVRGREESSQRKKNRVLAQRTRLVQHKERGGECVVYCGKRRQFDNLGAEQAEKINGTHEQKGLQTCFIRCQLPPVAVMSHSEVEMFPMGYITIRARWHTRADIGVRPEPNVFF